MRWATIFSKSNKVVILTARYAKVLHKVRKRLKKHLLVVSFVPSLRPLW